MKIYLMPKTFSGKLSVGSGFVLAVSIVLSVIFAVIIGGDFAVVADSSLLTILAVILSIIFTLAGPLSFFVGIYTIIRYKEWSIYKPLAVLYGFTLLVFLLGEFLFPH